MRLDTCVQQVIASKADRNLAGARAYIRRLLRDGRLTPLEARSQLEDMKQAVRAGRQVLVVRDIEHKQSQRRRNHAA
jgi:hypothetical protein